MTDCQDACEATGGPRACAADQRTTSPSPRLAHQREGRAPARPTSARLHPTPRRATSPMLVPQAVGDPLPPIPAILSQAAHNHRPSPMRHLFCARPPWESFSGRHLGNRPTIIMQTRWKRVEEERSPKRCAACLPKEAPCKGALDHSQGWRARQRPKPPGGG